MKTKGSTLFLCASFHRNNQFYSKTKPMCRWDNWHLLTMKKIAIATCFVLGLCFAANAQQPQNNPQQTANDVISAMRKADTRQNSCYTNEGKEGRFRPTERTTTTTSSNTQGSSYNSGSTSTSGSTGASIGTNTSATTNMSRTYNSGSSSSNRSNSSTQTTTTKEVCVDKDKLPLYK